MTARKSDGGLCVYCANLDTEWRDANGNVITDIADGMEINILGCRVAAPEWNGPELLQIAEVKECRSWSPGASVSKVPTAPPQ